MKSDGKWFVRNTAGKVFGPIDFETLQAWVRDGRVEPLAGISEDLQNWMLAPLRPELEMDWIVENNPGQFYGPTHKNVVDDFVKAGTLSPGARFYCDDRGKSLKAFNDLKAKQEKESVELAETKAELEKVLAEKAAAEDKVLKALDDLKAVNSELENAKSTLEKTKVELDGLKAEREAVHAREWKTDVLVPEVVVSDEPPPLVAKTAFGAANMSRSASSPFDANPSSLAALERQAQAELARMGTSGAKKFFGIGKKK